MSNAKDQFNKFHGLVQILKCWSKKERERMRKKRRTPFKNTRNDNIHTNLAGNWDLKRNREMNHASCGGEAEVETEGKEEEEEGGNCWRVPWPMLRTMKSNPSCSSYSYRPTTTNIRHDPPTQATHKHKTQHTQFQIMNWMDAKPEWKNTNIYVMW